MFEYIGHCYTPGPLLIHSFTDWLIKSSFSSKSSKHHKSQTIGARDLEFLHNVHVSCVTCPGSPVTCQIGGASWWRVCYQRGLPRLVYKPIMKFQKQFGYLLIKLWKHMSKCHHPSTKGLVVGVFQRLWWKSIIRWLIYYFVFFCFWKNPSYTRYVKKIKLKLRLGRMEGTRLISSVKACTRWLGLYEIHPAIWLE